MPMREEPGQKRSAATHTQDLEDVKRYPRAHAQHYEDPKDYEDQLMYQENPAPRLLSTPAIDHILQKRKNSTGKHISVTDAEGLVLQEQMMVTELKREPSKPREEVAIPDPKIKELEEQVAALRLEQQV